MCYVAYMAIQCTHSKGKVGKMPYLRMAVSPCLTVMLSVPRVKSTLRTGSPVGRRQSNLSRTSGNCFRSGWALATMAGLVEFRCLYLSLSAWCMWMDRCRKKNSNNSVQLSLWSTAPERGGDFTVLLSCHFLLCFSVSCRLLPPLLAFFFKASPLKKSLSTTFSWNKAGKNEKVKRKKSGSKII